MRGAQYNFNGGVSQRRKGRRIGGVIRFTLRVAAFVGAIFFIIAYWPDNWMELLIGFLEWLRYR